MVWTNFCISAFYVHNDSQRIKLFLIKRQSVWTRTIIIIKTTRMSAWHQGTQSFVWRLCWRSVHRYKSLTRSGSLAISVVDGSRRGLTSRFTSSNGYRGYTLVYLSCHWQHLKVDLQFPWIVLQNNEHMQTSYTSWWFQPIWKTFVKLNHFLSIQKTLKPPSIACIHRNQIHVQYNTDHVSTSGGMAVGNCWSHWNFTGLEVTAKDEGTPLKN